MKKLSLLFVFILTSCAFIYGHRSFSYKFADDWNDMTLEDVKKIVENGGDIHERNRYGYTPLKMACRYNLHLDIVKFMIDNGASPTECDFSEYVRNISLRNNFKLAIKGSSVLLSMGVPASSYAEEIMLNTFPEEQETIVETFKKYNVYPSKDFLRNAIIKHPMKYKELQKIYNVTATDKEIALWRIKSPFMQEKRNTKDWYTLVEQVKNLGIIDGNIGISKSSYITKHGVPDKEYKVNNETTILVYIQESRVNIPVSAHTSSYSYGTANYNQFFDNIQENTYGDSYTRIHGGYMKINQWQQSVYIDKGIVTGVTVKDKIVTH